MAKQLTKRTTKQTATKTKEAPEPETYTEQGPVNVAVREESFLGKCVTCRIFNANSRADSLCLNCHKEAAGFEFNETKNRYTKKGK